MQRVILLFLLFTFVPAMLASSFTPRTNRCNPTPGQGWQCIGYWVYLPNSYNASSPNQHPTIVQLHGLGQAGNGSLSALQLLLTTGMGNYLNSGQWPAAWDFIVFVPQDFNGWWNEARVDNAFVTMFHDYAGKIDQTRIYLTGYSAGGGGVWAYAGYNTTQANYVAAIAPVCGTDGVSGAPVTIMVQANLPVWAFHNNGDPQVAVGISINSINNLNAAGINPTAKITIYNSNSHDAWTATYNPVSSPMYSWFLGYSRKPLTPN